MTVALRVGLLGAARIAPGALIEPAAARDDVRVVALGCRDLERGRAFGKQHGIDGVGSYEELIARADVDAVYVALPTALHARWAIAALESGKHVLCEKPFAANAREAALMIDAARAAGRVLAEAFHDFYHPFGSEMRNLGARHLTSAAARVEATFSTPVADPEDIRRKLSLGGGALMDLGCYPIHWVRTLLNQEPTVVSAEAKGAGGIDEAMSAELRFPSGATARVRCSMLPSARHLARVHAVAPGVELTFQNPLAPQTGNSIVVVEGGQRSQRSVPGGSSYGYQLAAFVDAVRGSARMPTSGDDALSNMSTIDAIYRAAGMQIRGTSQ
jgi:predicted dehydrogenase